MCDSEYDERGLPVGERDAISKSPKLLKPSPWYVVQSPIHTVEREAYNELKTKYDLLNEK